MDKADVAKPESLDQSFHDFVMRDRAVSFRCRWCRQSVLDDDLGRDVRQFPSRPRLHLLTHGLEIALHPIDTYRDAIDERERLRVFRKHRSEHAWDKVANPTENIVARDGVEPPTPTFSDWRS